MAADFLLEHLDDEGDDGARREEGEDVPPRSVRRHELRALEEGLRRVGRAPGEVLDAVDEPVDPDRHEAREDPDEGDEDYERELLARREPEPAGEREPGDLRAPLEVASERAHSPVPSSRGTPSASKTGSRTLIGVCVE